MSVTSGECTYSEPYLDPKKPNKNQPCPLGSLGGRHLQQNPQKTMPVYRQQTLYELGCHLGYQGPRTDCPDLCDKSARGTFNILQVNIAGINSKLLELRKILKEKYVHIALIQETTLSKKGKISVPGYTSYRCTCVHQCQGVMTLIHNDVQATVTNIPEGDVDIQKIEVWTDSSKHPTYKLFNTYYPPSSCRDLPFNSTTYKKTVIAGDFNPHLPSLGYSNYNQRGLNVEKMCNTSNLILLQNKESPPTLLHKAHGTTSRPDLTMISADIIDMISITVLEDIGSDHRPMLIKLDCQRTCIRGKRRTLWNFKKANWKDFQTLTNAALNDVNEDKCINTTYSKICDAIITSAKKTIPRGNRKKYKPFWTKELENATSERKKARRRAEKSPSNENRIIYNKLTAEVRKLTKESKKKAWTETVENIDLNKESHKAWKLLNNLEGKSSKKNPEPLQCEGGMETDTKKKADIFNKHYANVNRSLKREPLDSVLMKQLKNKQETSAANITIFDDDFKLSEMETAMKKLACRKSPGPDGIKNEMICHLGHLGKKKLLQFINRTWKENKMPKEWLTAKIIPILKQGKTAGQPKSYRPISLTSCVGKLAERMVNNRLYWWLEKNKILNDSQAGFRKRMSH